MADGPGGPGRLEVRRLPGPPRPGRAGARTALDGRRLSWRAVTRAAPTRLLTIAGSDSGGGAGIQADLKAFARCGAHGMSAITAITAQNTVAVTGVYPLPPEAIVAQVRAVAEDIGVDAVKIGMLGTARDDRGGRAALDLHRGRAGRARPRDGRRERARLLDEDAEEALRTRLLPRVTVVTPNLPEARVLAGAGEGAERREATLARADPRARARERGRHRRPPRAGASTCSSTVSGWSRCPASATPRAPRTARAAPTRLRWRLTSRSASIRSRRPGGPSRSPSEAVRDGLRGLGAGAGPVDALGLLGSRRGASV